jgi:hypothetical protein
MEIIGSSVLGVLGFTKAGVVTGSGAAFFHSVIGVVKVGTIFAGLQSAGALGTGAAVTAIGTGTAITAGLSALGILKLFKK